MGAEIDVLSILGLSATSIANAFLGALTKWVSAGAATVVAGAGSALETTTAVPINGGFMAVFDELRTIGAPLVALFAGFAVIRAVIRQDLAEL